MIREDLGFAAEHPNGEDASEDRHGPAGAEEPTRVLNPRGQQGQDPALGGCKGSHLKLSTGEPRKGKPTG